MSSRYLRYGVITAAVAACALVPVGAAGASDIGVGGAGLDRTIVHQVPMLPLTIDGASVPGGAITQYNGRPLYMAVVPEGGAPSKLAAFTKPADFESYVHAQGGPEHALAKPQEMTPEKAATHAPPDRSALTSGKAGVDYSYASYIYSGDSWWFFSKGVSNGWGYPDLTRVNMFCPIFCISWNDEASSTFADTPRGQMLWEHTGWGGSALWLPGGLAAPYLSYFGWDNRASGFASY